MMEVCAIIVLVLIGAIDVRILISMRKERKAKKKLLDNLETLMEGYYHSKKIFSENPEKFSTYKEEIEEWFQKIEAVQEGFAIKVLEDKNVTKEWQFDKAKEMLALLEKFHEWKQGKIE